MSADLFAGDAHMEGNDMAGPAGGPGAPNRWLPDAAFQGQPMHQQVERNPTSTLHHHYHAALTSTDYHYSNAPDASCLHCLTLDRSCSVCRVKSMSVSSAFDGAIDAPSTGHALS